MHHPLFNMTILELVTHVGYVGLFLIVFAESSIFLNFFLPGSSLLFTAGVLASQGFFHIVPLIITLALAAILGDSFGYYIGTRIGPAIFTREDSRFFKSSHVKKTEEFYERYGPKAIFIGRFVPIVRSFVPMLAGVGSMQYGKFLFYNILGGIAWSAGVTSLGFLLGTQVKNVDVLILPIVGLIILLSFLPIFIEFWRTRKIAK